MQAAVIILVNLLICLAVDAENQYADGNGRKTTLKLVDKASPGLLHIECERTDVGESNFEDGRYVIGFGGHEPGGFGIMKDERWPTVPENLCESRSPTCIKFTRNVTRTETWIVNCDFTGNEPTKEGKASGPTVTLETEPVLRTFYAAPIGTSPCLSTTF